MLKALRFTVPNNIDAYYSRSILPMEILYTCVGAFKEIEHAFAELLLMLKTQVGKIRVCFRFIMNL